MSRLAMVFGFLLIVLGIGVYIATGAKSGTALIPAYFGLPLALCGVIAGFGGEKARMHAMHAAMLVGLLGALGSAAGAIKTIGSLGGKALERPTASYAQTAMFVLCAAFTVLGVRSFVAARRKRREEARG